MNVYGDECESREQTDDVLASGLLRPPDMNTNIPTLATPPNCSPPSVLLHLCQSVRGDTSARWTYEREGGDSLCYVTSVSSAR